MEAGTGKVLVGTGRVLVGKSQLEMLFRPTGKNWNWNRMPFRPIGISWRTWNWNSTLQVMATVLFT